MPPVRGGCDDGALAFDRVRFQHQLFRRLQRHLFDEPPFAVQAVELGGDAGRLVGVGREKQLGAKRGIADAAAGIDARPEQEAEMIRPRRLVEARAIEERGHARPRPRAHDAEPLHDEGAIESGQRRDIGDRRQRDKIERGEKVGREARRRPEAALA